MMLISYTFFTRLFHVPFFYAFFHSPFSYAFLIRLFHTPFATQEISCVYTKESLVYTRDLLCMHNSLVHVLGQGPQGPGTQRGSGPGPGTGPAASSGPWPLGSLAQSMHKSVVQHSACTGDLLCIHKRYFCAYTRVFLCRHSITF